MIKKIGINELTVGMQVCGIKKTHGEASFFLNNILIRTEEDIRGFAKASAMSSTLTRAVFQCLVMTRIRTYRRDRARKTMRRRVFPRLWSRGRLGFRAWERSLS